MPRYEYRCEKCGGVFEVQQKFSDAPLETHDDCGGRVERLISAPAFQFKGSGWYVTDYARGSAGTKPDAPKSGEAKSDSGKSDAGKSEPAKTDSKPAESTTKPASDK